MRLPATIGSDCAYVIDISLVNSELGANHLWHHLGQHYIFLQMAWYRLE